MTEPGYPTSLGVSTEATISLLGEDITEAHGIGRLRRGSPTGS